MEKGTQQIPRVLVALSTVVKSHRDKLAGILRYASLHGPWDVQTLEDHPYIAKLGAFKHWRPDGIIYGAAGDGALLSLMQRQRIPAVRIDQSAPRVSRYPAVRHAPNLIAQAAADHLLQLGLPHFAFVGRLPDFGGWAQTRAEAFAARLAAAGKTCRRYTSVHPDDWGLEQPHMQAWLTALPKPCGIMVTHDPRAKQVLDACIAAGVSVPDDVAVIGVDNDLTICENTVPTLSSVFPDFEGGGYLAAGMLAGLLRSKRTRKPPDLTYGIRGVVQRQSTMHFGHSNRLIAMAVEYIRLNACAGIMVPDVVRHLNVSRRYAEYRFRATLGHSILDEIQGRQIEHACALLRETSLPIGEIGERCGYTSEAYFKTLFKRRFGMTMRTCRKTIIP